MSEGWQDAVKPGDKLLRYGRGSDMIVTVSRLTPASIFYTGGRFEWRASRKNGVEVGGDRWSTFRVRPATSEDAKRISDRNVMSWAKYESAMHIGRLSPDQIRQVRALVESFAGGEA